MEHVLKFLFGSLETVRCESSWTGRDRRASELNVVKNIVFDWCVWGRELGEGGKLRQQVDVGVCVVLGAEGEAG